MSGLGLVDASSIDTTAEETPSPAMSLMLAPSTLFTARDDEDGASSDGDDRDVPDLAHGEGEPGKAKRQVLSCTTCRKRKVKVSRPPAPIESRANDSSVPPPPV